MDRLYLVATTLSILFLFLFPAPSLAQSYYFQDEFNQERAKNTLDSDKWNILPNNNVSVTTVWETGGNVQTGQNLYQPQYPLVISKNQIIPDGDFSVEIRFRYTNTTFWGTGIVLSETPPTNGQNFDSNIFKINVWQDNSVGPNMRVQFGTPMVKTIPTNTNWHIFKTELIGNKYNLYLDDTLVYTSAETTKRVKYIWIGNPVFANPPIPQWTSFNIDYIRVSQLNTKTPLIFIPGIGGSELKAAEDINWEQPNGHGGTYKNSYKKDEKVWVNDPEARALGNDDYFDVLRMKSDGINSEAKIEITGSLFAGVYQPTIDFFTSNGYTFGKDFFVFPYDWRKDISSMTPLLDQKINEVVQQTRSSKVDIVAHSMGGLISRNYIQSPQNTGKIRKLITLGSPYLGTVKGINDIIYGECFTLFEQLKQPLCLGLSKSEVKDVSQNLISTFELIPSRKYYEFYTGTDPDHPLPFWDSRDIDNNGIKDGLNYQQIKDLLINLGYNTSLFAAAETFHDLDNNISNTNGVETTIIAGSGIATLGQIVEKNIIDLAQIKVSKKDELQINGDDTVPLFSASLNDPSKNLSLLGDARVYYAKLSHNALVTDNSTLNLVKNILNNDSTLPSGIQTQPFNFKGKGLSVHSPVNMHVYDSQGRHTGPLPNGDFEINIPGSSYDTLDDAKFIFLPEDGNYQIKFESTGQGSFDFKIRNYENNTNNQTILYKNIPLNSSTKADASFDTTSSNPPTLSLDKNGDGITDSQITPTSILIRDTNSDQSPPQTTAFLSGDLGNDNWYKSDVTVTLEAKDEDNGSGINKIEYSLDNGETINIYKDPFTISTEGINNLKFRSIDNAGNEENPQELEIKIDKTLPRISINTNPNILWPPNNKMVDVFITGLSKDTNLKSTNLKVTDEYGLIEPELTNFGQTIKLEARRNGDDLDGRVYTITGNAEDLAGNISGAETKVIVPHDQRR